MSDTKLIDFDGVPFCFFAKGRNFVTLEWVSENNTNFVVAIEQKDANVIVSFWDASSIEKLSVSNEPEAEFELIGAFNQV